MLRYWFLRLEIKYSLSNNIPLKGVHFKYVIIDGSLSDTAVSHHHHINGSRRKAASSSAASTGSKQAHMGKKSSSTSQLSATGNPLLQSTVT